jgi:RND family efflux transporter MFP subunit
MKLQKLVTSFLLFSLVVGLVGCSKETVVEEEPATAVAVLPASRGQLVCWERVSGKAGAQEEVYIVPQLGGEIKAVEVKTGDRVEKGQVLVRLDNTDLMLQVEQAEAGLQVAQAQLDRALAGASEEDLTRLEAAVAQAEAGVEAAILHLYSVLGGFSPVHQQLAGAEAQYRQAQIARKQAENQLYQVMYGSAIEQADLAVDQAREARDILKDRLEDLEDNKESLERQIRQIENWATEKAVLEGKGETLSDEEAKRLAELEELLSNAPAVTELKKDLVELEALIRSVEPEYEMAKYQVEQAKVARDRVLIETREQAELALEQAEEAEKAARRQVEMLRKTAAQQEQLALGQKTQAEAGLEAARAGLEQARKGAREEDLRVAEAGVKQARAALALARRQLKRGTIEAPISGVVTALDAQVGALAGPGTPLMAIVNPNLIKVEFNLTERLIDKVAPGDEVVVRFLSLPGQEFSGVVTAVSPAADPRTGVFLVEATLENEAGLLAPGFFAEVDLVVDASEGNLVIPRSALLREGDQYYVYIVEGERARKKLVTLGLSDGEKVEVLSGLEEDDLVVIKGQHYLEEGSKVSISEGLGGDGE